MSATASRAELEALEATSLPAGGPRFLFASRPDLSTPLHELANENEALARAAHAVCRRCKDVVCHVFEFAHDPLEALSFLACHGWPTPLLDLSASASFAQADAAVTVLDLSALPEHFVVRDLSFLADCGELSEPPRLWLERRSVALTHVEWRNFDTAADFGLDDPGFTRALTTRHCGDELPPETESARAAPTSASCRDLHEAIRRAGRKILGPGGVEAIEELIARLPAG